MELVYLGVIFVLLLVPRVLQRFRIPAPLTTFSLGLAAGLLVPDVSAGHSLALLAVLGISSLFLFAGLEVDPAAFRRARWPLLGHLALRAAVLSAMVWGGAQYAGLQWQAATLFALALLTPSTGFILDTLAQQGLDEEERFWVGAKAVAGEILALAVLFLCFASLPVPACVFRSPWRRP